MIRLRQCTLCHSYSHYSWTAQSGVCPSLFCYGLICQVIYVWDSIAMQPLVLQHTVVQLKIVLLSVATRMVGLTLSGSGYDISFGRTKKGSCHHFEWLPGRGIQGKAKFWVNRLIIAFHYHRQWNNVLSVTISTILFKYIIILTLHYYPWVLSQGYSQVISMKTTN